MAEEQEVAFGKAAAEKGYCTQAQIDDALHTLDEVRKLGLDERFENILLKKKVLSAEQIKSVYKEQGRKTKITLEHYELLEKIGQGGMGVVFKARQISLDRIVALKILSPKLAADASFAERFTKEARAVAKLSHPNIVNGIDVQKDGKYHLFAMEFVEGETALRILRNQPFTEARALDVAIQVTRALEHASKLGMVHRDIKPDNIMVTSRDEAKVLDYGLAKLVENSPSTSQVGLAVGTPHYIAPEQARGEVDVDSRADIYALGGTLYHMVTGQTLFQGKSSNEIMVQHLSGEAPSPKKLKPELSDNFCRLLEKMLAKTPADRFASPAELLEELDRVAAGKPLKHPPPANVKSSIVRIKPQVSKGVSHTTGPQPPVSKQSSGRNAAGGRPTTGPREPIGRPDDETGQLPQKKSNKPLILGIVAALVAVSIGAAVLMSGGNKETQAKGGDAPTTEPAKSPAKTSVPTQVQPSTTPVANPQDHPPQPPDVPSGYEPLDKARKFRRENPSKWPEAWALFDEAEKGTKSGELIATIRREKTQIEQDQLAYFRDLLNRRTNEARTAAERKDFRVALAQFDEGVFPEWARQGGYKDEIVKRRTEFEGPLVNEFNKSQKPNLEKGLSDAGWDAAKLNTYKQNVDGMKPNWPAKAAQDQLGWFIGEADKRLNAIKHEAEAHDLIKHVKDLFKEAQNPNLPQPEKEKRRQEIKGLIDKIEKEYADTDAWKNRDKI